MGIDLFWLKTKKFTKGCIFYFLIIKVVFIILETRREVDGLKLLWFSFLFVIFPPTKRDIYCFKIEMTL